MTDGRAIAHNAVCSRALKTVQTCFAVVRHILSIRHCLPQQALLSLVTSLVSAWLDWKRDVNWSSS